MNTRNIGILLFVFSLIITWAANVQADDPEIQPPPDRVDQPIVSPIRGEGTEYKVWLPAVGK